MLTQSCFSGAGADTTSIAIRACLQAICLRREVYERLQAEIDQYYEKAQLAEPISYLQCQNLPYLLAVTREAMRLLPSIVFQLLRYSPDTGLTVNGKYIPPGTPVGISPIAQNRDPQIWGSNADKFWPERWLESEEKSRYLESNNMTFGGSGPRMCVGRNIALVSRKSLRKTLFVPIEGVCLHCFYGPRLMEYRLKFRSQLLKFSGISIWKSSIQLNPGK